MSKASTDQELLVLKRTNIHPVTEIYQQHLQVALSLFWSCAIQCDVQKEMVWSKLISFLTSWLTVEEKTRLLKIGVYDPAKVLANDKSRYQVIFRFLIPYMISFKKCPNIWTNWAFSNGIVARSNTRRVDGSEAGWQFTLVNCSNTLHPEAQYSKIVTI